MTKNHNIHSSFILALALFAGSFVFTACSSDDGHPRLADYEEKTVHESTKGVESEVEEVEPGNDYLIIDERIIDEKEDSRAIVHLLTGETDTVSFASMVDADGANGEGTSGRRYSALRGILIYGVARSFFTRNMGNVNPNPRYYKNTAAYNKSAGLKGDMMASSKTRSVRSPKGKSSGYGSGRSFRSHGG